jgi:hypothetical protein
MLHISLRMPNWIGQRGSRSARSVKWFSFYRHGRVTQNRSWELQLDYWGWGKLFGLDLGLDWEGSDHAGPEIELTILGFTVHFTMPRNDHWDYDTNTWESEETVQADIEEWQVQELKEACELLEDEENHQGDLERAREVVAAHEARLAEGTDQA